MQPPDPYSPSLDPPAFRHLPRDPDGPIFSEPWQAQAFALAVRLSAQGCFTWREWSSSLGEELAAAAARGAPDDGSHYYEHWLAALEKLVAAKGVCDAATLDRRKREWEAAYRATPHGQPVELTVGQTGSRSD